MIDIVDQLHRQKALDPFSSFWVTASAGSGKTKLLTDRILRLMLQGARPGSLLCLTFTKAAAGEMFQRLESRLSFFYSAPQEELCAELKNCLQRSPSPEDISLARGLLSEFLDEAFQIQTLHSFCQRFLQKFPLEAGLPVSFQILDEVKGPRLWQKAYDQIMDQAYKDIDLEHLLQELAKDYTEDQLQSELWDLYSRYGSGLCQIDSPFFPEKEWPLILSSEKITAITSLSLTVTQAKKMEGLQALRFSKEYNDVFLTTQGACRKTVLSEKFPQEEWLKEEQSWVQRYNIYENNRHKAQNAWRLISLFGRIQENYTALKKEEYSLDFKDLISTTLQLMNDPANMGWILYKMDHQIDHILIDEAQDTSAEQWELIKVLAESLWSSSPVKTLFVVADPKQSIYGFQGADLDAFYSAHSFLKQCAQQWGVNFQDLTLSVSFRTTSVLLDFFNQVFPSCPLIPQPFPPHSSALPFKGGYIEYWPPVPQSTENPDVLMPLTKAQETAKHWAEIISQWQKKPFFLQTAQRPVMLHDIMILIPKRCGLFQAILEIFAKAGLGVCEKSALTLEKDPVLADVMTLVDFMLNSKDDWSLAGVLKSPLGGSITEQELYELAYNRGSCDLFQRLQQHPSPRFQEIVQQLQQWYRAFHELSPFQWMCYLIHVCRIPGRYQGYRDCYEAFEDLLALLFTFSEKGYHWQEFLSLWPSFRASKKEGTPPKERIQLLTIHGSKGLQAPVIVIPDLEAFCPEKGLFVHQGGRPLLNLPQTPDWIHPEQKALQAFAQQQWMEYNRLLYVAMTRAQERLYMGALHAPVEGSWHQKILHTISRVGKKIDVQKKDTRKDQGKDTEQDQKIQIYRIEKPPLEPQLSNALSPEPAKILAPDIPLEKGTHPLDFCKPRFSFSLNKAQDLGLWIHEILDKLPGSPLDPFKTSVEFLLGKGCSLKQAQFWARRCALLISDEKFSFLFGPNSSSEVSVALESPSGPQILRIDRLIRHPRHIDILDFKIDKICPAAWPQVPMPYQQQLSSYAQAIASIYPDHAIRQGIVWMRQPLIIWKTKSIS